MLSLHGIFLTGIHLVDFLDFGGKDAHLGLRHVALVGEGEEDELDEYGQQQNDDTIVGNKSAEEAEHGYNHKFINPAEETPSQRHEARQLEVFIGRDDVIQRGQQRVVVGTEVEVEAGDLLVFGRVLEGGIHAHFLEARFVFLSLYGA